MLSGIFQQAAVKLYQTSPHDPTVRIRYLLRYSRQRVDCIVQNKRMTMGQGPDVFVVIYTANHHHTFHVLLF